MFRPITVLFDSSVLYPAPIRDILIELAINGLYQAKWTEEIHEEWIRNLLKNRKDLQRFQLERTKDLMNKSIPDCLVCGYKNLINIVNLPDPDDQHVVAAAIKSNSQLIVTNNIKDFPNNVLSDFDIESINADDFFLDQLDLNRPLFLRSIKEIRKRLKSPPKTSEEYLFILQQVRLFSTVEELEKYADLI